jgi:hypothetical protein
MHAVPPSSSSMYFHSSPKQLVIGIMKIALIVTHEQTNGWIKGLPLIIFMPLPKV